MECLRDEFTDGVVLDGRYETLSPLNHGSFGMVFKAKDLHSGETVAIKCLTKKSAADEAGYDFAIDEKFEELTLHRRLGNHPNIVNLIRAFETDAHVYLVLEYCHQGDLYEAIRGGHGPLETEHVRQFMLQLVDAVAYIHTKGIYHRDIKPENIFLSKDGAMKLGDFGLATTDKWSFENAVGSDRYMSPEQYDSAGAGYSAAQADVWAIGICLLNILFSRNPFTTPTEADPLFLDFSRDKQSLFDVFPSMSQDTYEVIVECMNLDPSKRSLHGAKRALNRVLSFTTLDEGDDEFCSAERGTIASANREPLRTPSIQSPQVDTGAFPWAKALHTTSAAQPIRQLSAIPDDESYSEDLFSKSAATTDWFSAQTPSISSILDSSFPTSMQSLNIRSQIQRAPAKTSPTTGSLPITMSRPRKIPAMSSVFGGNDTVSKSWSDLWEEEEEENQQEERSRQLQALKKMNSRTWSQDSKVDDDTPRQGLSPVVKSSSINAQPRVIVAEDAIDMDGDLPDGFFFQDITSVKHHDLHTQRCHSPPMSKKDQLDKWAKLGDRRRAYTGSQESMPKPDFLLKTGRQSGNSVFGYGVLGDSGTTNLNNFSLANHHSHMMNNKHSTRERVKECPWGKSKGRDLNWNWRREKRLGEVEWVGASWQEAHS